ncbi:hypothetical protein [uncultured Nevskia sp.]|uniref:hypothetical protein n=1 Tax=uncultured Nevskia sp. TaxID=228950 RepID=UPI0025F9A3AB|nr:hypothetical protein [uncultured Nevskia sp.]
MLAMQPKFLPRVASSLAPTMRTVSRVLLAVVGAYFFTTASVMLAARGIADLGLFSRSDAVVLAAMFGFLLYLGLLLWAFAERRLWRLAIVLGGGTLLLHGAASLLQTPA